MYGVKDKQNQALVKEIRTDFNQQSTNVIGKRVQLYLGSTSIFTEATQSFKGRMVEYGRE